MDAYLADKSPQAYEKVVDRLLDSPRYGEHQARYWLDAARYADSHGYHIDSDRSMWKYREWVINAYNKNMPFDQFTIEQLAGDMLPGATTEQKIGSGYVRCNPSTGEGGAIVEEYQAKYSFDRTETTSTIWMGLTMTCARCHTHKYDPIQHHEYYGLYALFNNLNESVMDDNKPNPAPFMKVPTPDQMRREQELKKLLADGRTKLEAPMPEFDSAQPAWEARWRGKLRRGLEPARTEVSHLHERNPVYDFRGFHRSGPRHKSAERHVRITAPGEARRTRRVAAGDIAARIASAKKCRARRRWELSPFGV